MGHINPAPLIAGLDIGSSVIATLIAALEPDGRLTFVAGSETHTRGLRGGVITNAEAAISSLDAALDHLEDVSGQRIAAAYLSIGGAHLHSRNTIGWAEIGADAQTKPDTHDGRFSADQAPGEVTHADIAQAVAVARAHISADERREILHIIPRAYAVDDIAGVRNPLGLVGYELGVETHIVTAATTVCQNLLRCARAAGVEPIDVIAAPLAASEGILGALDRAGIAATTRRETLTAAIVDIGAETTGLAIYADGAIWRTLSLSVGGAMITQQIATELRLTDDIAEALKRRFGASVGWQAHEDELIDLRPFTQRDELLARRLLAELIEARVRELAATLYTPLREARQAGVRPQWLALAGGGASLGGLAEFLADDLRLPVYVASPATIEGLPDDLAHPGFATVAGVVTWGARQLRNTASVTNASAVRRGRRRRKGPLAGITRALWAIPHAGGFWRRAEVR